MPADPDWSTAVIPTEKLVDYLLAPDHPEGGPKAAFFLSCGFRPTHWHELEAALRAHPATASISSTQSPYGVKYVADGLLLGQDGRTRQVRSVWIVETGSNVPRFVTAYPLEAPDGVG